jgi:hypothetical protein
VRLGTSAVRLTVENALEVGELKHVRLITGDDDSAISL